MGSTQAALNENEAERVQEALPVCEPNEIVVSPLGRVIDPNPPLPPVALSSAFVGAASAQTPINGNLAAVAWNRSNCLIMSG